jgi:hypothetical protein
MIKTQELRVQPKVKDSAYDQGSKRDQGSVHRKVRE